MSPWRNCCSMVATTAQAAPRLPFRVAVLIFVLVGVAALVAVVGAVRRRIVIVGASAVLVAVAALMLAATAWGATGLEPPEPAVVTSVADGDTIHVETTTGRETIRVLGVDTPEIAHPSLGIAAECYGSTAKAFAQVLLYEHRPIWIQVDKAAGDHDRYGRKLRIVRFYTGAKPGRTYERRLLLAGLANYYDFGHEPLAMGASWLAQRNLALGWGGGLAVGAWSSCPGPSGNGPSTDVFHGWSTGPA